MEKLSHTTESILDENVEKLAELFPEVVTEVREPDGSLRHTIDVDALRERVGDVAEGQRERYQFTWPGKREAKQEAYRQIDKCLRPCPEESVDWDTTGNLYIEGDNLDALKLLRNTYAGKVKMIYIDPPYNTGHDFIYDDDFARSKAEYDAESGDYDEEGGRLVANPESNGRFHSDWCSMMYPRLLLARDLLSEEGAIFVSIDENELKSIGLLCDQVFGATNFVEVFVYDKKAAAKGVPPVNMVCSVHEYIFVYAKRRDSFKFIGVPRNAAGFSNPDGDPRGPWRNTNIKSTVNENRFSIVDPQTGYEYTDTWAYSPVELNRMIQEGRIIFPKTPDGQVRAKEYFEEFKNPYIPVKTSLGLYDAQWNTEMLTKLMGGKYFPNPKHLKLMHDLLAYCVMRRDVVFDFFSGSATTAHAVMRLNAEDGGSRKFIMVQLPETCDKKSEAAKAGYKNICEIGKERIRRAGKKIASEVEDSNRQLKLGEEPKKVPDIGFRVLKIDSSNFEEVSSEPGEYSQDAMLRFADNLKLDRMSDDLIIQVMLKKQIELSAPIEKLDIDGCAVFSVDNGRLVACFDRDVPVEVMTAMAKMEPDYAVMRDASFASDDAVSNFAEVFKNYSSITEVEVI